ncbi:MAG: hypothetical protein ACQET0_01705 [Pseudomonadota bacterium]
MIENRRWHRYAIVKLAGRGSGRLKASIDHSGRYLQCARCEWETEAVMAVGKGCSKAFPVIPFKCCKENRNGSQYNACARKSAGELREP